MTRDPVSGCYTSAFAPVISHSIRLRGPWEVQPLVRFVDDGSPLGREEPVPPAAPHRVEMPCDWGPLLGHDFRGRVRYLRRFGCPTGLNPAIAVWLVFDRIDGDAELMLNDQRLGSLGPHQRSERFDITGLLWDRNVLVVDVELARMPPETESRLRADRAGLPGGLVGEVRLEITAATDVMTKD